MGSAAMREIPKRSRCTVLNLSIGYLGLQITFGIESSSLSRVYQGFGASVDDLAMLWLAGPVAGLIVQPLIGPLSDRTWTRFGRRRPFMLVSGLIAIMALIQLAYAPNLVTAIAMVWLLEVAMNALNAPYRALVGDTLPVSQQGEGFAMQTVFIGLGAFLGAFAPKLLNVAGVSNMAGAGSAALSIQIAFLAAALCLAVSIGWTMFAVREYSRSDYARFGVVITDARTIASRAPERLRALLPTLWAYRRFAAIQCFAWAGLYLLWVYATPVVASHAFGATSPFDRRFADGADWVGVMFGTYNGIAGLFAFVLPQLFSRFGVRLTHTVALVAGALGLAGIALMQSHWALLGCAVLIGVAYSSILSAPFVMASRIARMGAAGSSIGIMNVFIVVPQLVMGLSMGFIMSRFFLGTPSIALFLASAFSLIAAMICITGKREN